MDREPEQGSVLADYLTPVEAAALTGTAESTWRRRAAAGLVPGAVIKGKQWLLPRQAVEAAGVRPRAKRSA
jgi:excisionase family DNA binding protein